MIRFLGWFSLLVLLAVAAFFGWNGYSDWRFSKDQAEAALAPQGQLPDTVQPTAYQLSLRINPDEERFSGRVFIDVEILEETDTIWLHGENIRAESAELVFEDGSRTPLEYREMGRSGVVRLLVSTPVSAQSAGIEILFDAPFNTKLAALYTVEEDGLNYAFTQFEPIYARQVFPQFDEPRFKTSYDIQLEVPEELRGLSSTPIVHEELLQDGFKRLTFATTKPMPSYLLAFAVGDLDIVEYLPIAATNIRSEPVPLRGVAAKGKGDQLGYALEHTAALLTTLEEYFGIPYPYTKLDIVAVPSFAAGAMENVGLITYRESFLLFESEPSISQQRRYANVHAHELAHQWFGNLVTMPWWDDIWLNESFATWMASKAVHAWNPELEEDREIIRRGHRVMGSDIYERSRRIREPVLDREGIANAFDGISYSKGGAVLQMLESMVSPAVFRAAIQDYMQRHAWGNATALDLIQSLERAADDPAVGDVATSFISQPGLPVLMLDWSCKGGDLSIELKQERFLPVGSEVSPAQEWVVPVCMTTVGEAGKGEVCQLLTQAQQQYSHPVAECPGAIMPNGHGHGYYRWSMPKPQWRRLLDNLAAFSPGEKYSVASSLAAEYGAGRIDTQFYLQAVTAIIEQPEWDVLTEPAWLVRYIRDNIAEGPQRDQLGEYLYVHYKPLLDELGLEPSVGEPAANQLLRSRILKLMAVDLQQQDVLSQLADRGRTLIGYGRDLRFDGSAIDPQLHSLAMASAVIVEGAPYFEQLMTMVHESTQANFKRDALWALGQTTDPELGERVLNVLQLVKLKPSEIQGLITAYGSKKENRQVTFDWFKRIYPVAAMVMPKSYLASTPWLASELCSVEAYEDAREFFAPKAERVVGMPRNLSQSLEQVKLCYSLVAAQRAMGWEEITP